MTKYVIPELSSKVTVDDVAPKINFINQQQNNVSPNVKVGNRFQSGIDSAKERNQEKENLYNQEVLVKLGGDFNPQGELDDNLLEFDMAGSENLVAKQQKFKNKYPEGSLIPLTMNDGSVELFFKKTPNEKYRSVNKGVNVPELARAVFSGETIGGVLGSRFGIKGTAGGTALGSLAETGIEKARGYEVGTAKDIGIETAKETGFATGFDLLTRGAFKIYNKIKNKNYPTNIAVEDFADDLQNFTHKNNLKGLSIGQVAKTDLVKSTYSQTKITDNKLKDLTKEQAQSLKDQFGKLGADFDPSLYSDEQLEVILKGQSDEILTKLLQNTNLNSSLTDDFAKAGKDFVSGINKWKASTKAQRDKYYDDAIKLADDVTFDLTSLQKIASDLQKGVQAKGVQKGALFDTETSIQLRQLPNDIKILLDDISSLNPQVSMYQGTNPIVQLKELRTRLYNLQQSEDPATKRYANKLFSELKEIMQKPQSGNKEFIKAYNTASAYNAYRENILNLSVIKRSLKSDSVEDIVQSKFNIINPSEVQYIKEVFKDDPKTFQMLKNVYLTNIVKNKSTLNQFLDKEDLYRETVNKIFTKGEVKAIKDFANAKSKINSSALNRSISQDISNAERAYQLIDQGYDAFGQLIKSQGGANSKFAQSTKAGIYKRILDKATTTNDQGINVLNLKLFSSEINKLKDNKALTDFLFTADDFKNLDMYNLYANTINISDDVGGAMQKGSIASDLKSFLNPKAKVKVGKTYLDNALMAKLLSLPYKSGNKVYNTTNVSENKLKYFVLGLNAINQNLNDERKKKDPRKFIK
tara:strand:+ start:304 stop:2733 length:2430 start_codon:yes stop_codon:yes gene_type:complete